MSAAGLAGQHAVQLTTYANRYAVLAGACSLNSCPLCPHTQDQAGPHEAFHLHRFINFSLRETLFDGAFICHVSRKSLEYRCAAWRRLRCQPCSPPTAPSVLADAKDVCALMRATCRLTNAHHTPPGTTCRCLSRASARWCLPRSGAWASRSTSRGSWSRWAATRAPPSCGPAPLPGARRSSSTATWAWRCGGRGLSRQLMGTQQQARCA